MGSVSFCSSGLWTALGPGQVLTKHRAPSSPQRQERLSVKAVASFPGLATFMPSVLTKEQKLMEGMEVLKGMKHRILSGHKLVVIQ